jgi:hypothetical protein
MTLIAKSSEKAPGILVCPKFKAGDPALTGVKVQNNLDGTVTVLGTSATGDVDISGAAKGNFMSNDSTVATVGTPTGMTAPFWPHKVGSCVFTFIIDWNDVTMDPTRVTAPVLVAAKPPSGELTVTFGEPTVEAAQKRTAAVNKNASIGCCDTKPKAGDVYCCCACGCTMLCLKPCADTEPPCMACCGAPMECCNPTVVKPGV